MPSLYTRPTLLLQLKRVAGSTAQRVLASIVASSSVRAASGFRLLWHADRNATPEIPVDGRPTIAPS